MAIHENVLMPDFAQNFKCVGSACTDTCCKEWTISIDKKTYKKYMSCPDSELLEKFKKYILVRNTKELYAEMSIGGSMAACVFFTEDRMCELQRKFGEDYLCHTCKTYPRSFLNINGNYELSLSPSCPEVAAHFLSQKRMEFVYSESACEKFSNAKLTNEQFSDFFDLRSFVIEILQDRRYIFEMRLILLGLFIQKVTQTNLQNIPDKIRSYKNMFRDTRVAEQFFELPVLPDFQFDVIERLITQSSNLTGQKNYEILFNETLRGLEFNEDRDTRARLQSYMDALDAYEERFLYWDHVMENYIVTTVFSDSKSFVHSIIQTKPDALWEMYLYICLSYRMLKFHMVGINKLRGLNDGEVVNIVSRFHRSVFGHNKTCIESMVKWLAENKYNTLAFMAVLVRT